MNDAAMIIPKRWLLAELETRIAERTAKQAARDARDGTARITLTSYMENIGWPELFGYAMPSFFADADFALEQSLRQQIFWTDNVPDDSVPTLTVAADVGMYWDMTLFGQRIQHSTIGVPEFLPHPFQQSGDLAALGTFNFYTTGDMPRLVDQYHRLQEISRKDYENKVVVTFPQFHRGPLDIYVTLRGYENFLDDVADRPEQLMEALTFIIEERWRFARERQRFLGKESLPSTTYVADDWVNLPFISPRIFRELVLPIYRRIRENEGPVTGFHTCGKMEELVPDLLAVFPEINRIDVSGWNDIRVLDAHIEPTIAFGTAMINTISLSDDQYTQREKLDAIAEVGKRRLVSLCAQAIVKLYPTYDETLARLGRFLALAREVFQQED